MQKQVNRHCNEYPQDVTYLGQILNMDIRVRNVVYITSSSNKYHDNPYCSGIKEASAVDLNEIGSANYVPCKRCIKGDT